MLPEAIQKKFEKLLALFIALNPEEEQTPRHTAMSQKLAQIQAEKEAEIAKIKAETDAEILKLKAKLQKSEEKAKKRELDSSSSSKPKRPRGNNTPIPKVTIDESKFIEAIAVNKDAFKDNIVNKVVLGGMPDGQRNRATASVLADFVRVFKIDVTRSKQRGADETTPVLHNAIKAQINNFLHRREAEKLDVSEERIRLLLKLRKLEKGKGRKGEVSSKIIDGCLECLIIEETNRLNALEKISVDSTEEDDGSDDDDDGSDDDGSDDDDSDDSYHPPSKKEDGESKDGNGKGEGGNSKRKEGGGKDGDGKRKESDQGDQGGGDQGGGDQGGGNQGEGEDGDGKSEEGEGDNDDKRPPTADEAKDGCTTPPADEVEGIPKAKIVSNDCDLAPLFEDDHADSNSFKTPPPPAKTSPNKSGNQRAKDRAFLEHHLQERHETMTVANVVATLSTRETKTYAEQASSGKVITATTSVSNPNCFTKGANKRANVADYGNSRGNKRPRVTPTVPKASRTVLDQHRTKLDRPKLVGNANDSRLGLTGKYLPATVARMQSR
jgi:hypothetical protein